ncbi:MAG: ribonuclease T [Hyphomicrobiaceae bacterium]
MRRQPTYATSPAYRRITVGRCLAAVIGSVLIIAAQTAFAQRAPSPQAQATAKTFDYYALVLSWSPTYCDEEGDERRDPQCRPRSERPFAFVLHGLWPQFERGFPNNCETEQRPFVSNEIIDAMLDIMPARGLIIHQYRKHGTCSGLSPSRYFGAARKLFEFINVPDMFVRPIAPQFVTIADVTQAFMDVNPGIRPDMIAVSCRRDRGNQLREVRICFTPQGRLRACGENEDQRRLCRAERMFVPPVRYRPL